MSGKNTATTGFLSGSADLGINITKSFLHSCEKKFTQIIQGPNRRYYCLCSFCQWLAWVFFLEHLNSLPLPQIIHFSQKVWEMSTHGTELTISGRYGPIIKQLIRFHQSLSSSGHLASCIDKIVSSERGSGN